MLGGNHIENMYGRGRRGQGGTRRHIRTGMLLEHEVKKDTFMTAKELKGMHAGVLGAVSVLTIQQHMQQELKAPVQHLSQAQFWLS